MGQLLHAHLDHAFANIDVRRTTRFVAAQLRPDPRLCRAGSDWQEVNIGEHEELFFAIHRLEFATTIEDTTEGAFLVLNLVAGERCGIQTNHHAPIGLRFAESIIIPARVDAFTLHNRGATSCKIVKAFVKG